MKIESQKYVVSVQILLLADSIEQAVQEAQGLIRLENYNKDTISLGQFSVSPFQEKKV